MTRQERDKWDHIYRTGGHGGQRPAAVLELHRHLLPASGRALDLACGQGANALLLAARGLTTHAWDISTEALIQLRAAAPDHVRLYPQQRDVIRQPPEPDSFDVIVVSNFLDRELAPRLTAALRPGGLLYYQTFIADRVTAAGPSNPDYLLGENELLRLFPGLHLVLYREEGSVGDTGTGFRNQAMLIGQRRGTAWRS